MMRIHVLRIAAIMLALSVSACQQPAPELIGEASHEPNVTLVPTGQDSASTPVGQLGEKHWSGASTPGAAKPLGADFAGEQLNGNLGTAVSVDLVAPKEPPFRVRRRMDIDQLDRAIQRVTGGVAWIEKNKNQFEELASTLGKPDFIDLTKEDLEPSALFQKFLDDAARVVCTELADKEPGIAKSERVLMVHVKPSDTIAYNPEGVDANLKMLVLRFHGRDISVNPAELEQWRWLYQSAEHVSKSPVAAWRTVCVGLMTHPYFYTY